MRTLRCPRRTIPLAAAVVSAVLLLPSSARPCTSIVVTRGASVDGSTMVTYAADAHELYGELYQTPGGVHAEGAELEVHDWDSGTFLSRIPQVRRTFSTVGNMNEHQLVIAETTFGGRKELVNPEGGIDYGSLIYVTLQRARTAREAIETIVALAEEHGYRSKGESLSIGDPHEAWVMEMIGKGPGRKGVLWVARRVPDGYVTAHANMARIRRFPLDDPRNTIYGKDVISFARERGYFTGKDSEFSFADAYAPLDPGRLRTCEARVWRVFSRLAPSAKLSPDFALGVEGAPLPPLWIKPDRKVSVADLTALMRDHFEGTELDLSQGIGAGPFGLPYRWRPLTWNVDGVEYLNERAIATQQTGFSFVSQSRTGMPGAIGGLLWFGVDDAASTVYVPVYAGVREVARPYAVGTATMSRFSWDSAFWIFNWVAQQAYLRYRDVMLDVRRVQGELEGGFFERQHAVEAAARKLYERSPELARDYLTDYSRKQAERTVERWRLLGELLLVKYLDGNVKDAHGEPTHPPYPDHWYRHIVAESGDRLRVPRVEGAEASKADGSAAAFTFTTRESLGPLATTVPADFPFGAEKLVLVPGNAQCGQLPRCCLAPREEDGRLVIDERTEDRPTHCGEPGVLVRLPAAEKRLPVRAGDSAR